MERAREELPAGRATLRRWSEDEADELFRVASDALPHLTPWMAWAVPGYTVDLVHTHLADAGRSWADGRAYNYAIRLPEGPLIGSCSMMGLIGPGGMEIGYWLHPAHTGRGHATAAVRALAAEAFRLGHDRVEIVHDVANVRSGAIPRRLGFTEVARRPPQEARTSGEAGEDVVWRLSAATQWFWW